MPNSAAAPLAMNWLVRWLAVKKICELLRALLRAWCEMTAAAIASSRAIIDFQGRVLRLTRSTCADRSICLTSRTRGSSLRGYLVRLTLSGFRRGRPDDPGELKHWGPGRTGQDPSG